MQLEIESHKGDRKRYMKHSLRFLILPCYGLITHLLFPVVSATPSIAPAQAPTLADVVSARGVVRADERAELAASMSGRLVEADYKVGMFFEAGALLARFDCRQQAANLTALSRAHESRQLYYENVAQLLAAGAAGALDVEIARAEMQKAEAEQEQAREIMKGCEIHAPYAGYIVSHHAHAYETLSIGTPLYGIIKHGHLQLSLIVPSDWVRWLKPNLEFGFTIDETDERFRAQIQRLGAEVDPVSQTLEAFAHIYAPSDRVRVGMSGVATFLEPP